MTIQEAIEKAGPGGKFRVPNGCIWVAPRGEYGVIADEGGRIVAVKPNDLTRADWQVVEPEVDKVIKEACDAMRRELDGFEQSLRKAREALDVPTIEVGDIVDETGQPHIRGEVKYIDPRGYAFVHIDRPNYFFYDNEPTHRTHINRLTLIRKGPRKHVFEGIEFTVSIDRDGEEVVVPMAINGHQFQYGKGVAHGPAYDLMGKTYRMTLEPMEEK